MCCGAVGPEVTTLRHKHQEQPQCNAPHLSCIFVSLHTSRICIHSPMTPRGEHDGSPCRHVNTARDSMHFPVSVLVVLAAVEHGETFHAAQSRWCSAKPAVLWLRSGEYAGYCFMRLVCRSAPGFQVTGCQIRQNVKLQSPGDGYDHVCNERNVLNEIPTCLSNKLHTCTHESYLASSFRF